ncbi:E3 ubiquitin ligase BIG BROTHER-related-like [Spinacia oleracea]|uniref:RING-type E3 ubiquitin transferase n=1 Tax=Spinacia oleracea TaxID=3562 RepID=A0ABM3R2Q0_SPIOL|nr:E3 ubiquitin ligase BIG BROTHER-related-like [Spinacia oleracea]
MSSVSQDLSNLNLRSGPSLSGVSHLGHDFAAFAIAFTSGVESTVIFDDIQVESEDFSLVEQFQSLERMTQNLDQYISSSHEEIQISEGMMVPADNTVMTTDVKRVSVQDYLAATRTNNAEELCSICLDDFKEQQQQQQQQQLMCLLPCNHGFHENCIGKWFKINHFCPLCRYELRS